MGWKINIYKKNFPRLPAEFRQNIIGTEKDLDSGKNLFSAEDKSYQGYSQTVSCFKHLSENHILQLFISQERIYNKQCECC